MSFSSYTSIEVAQECTSGYEFVIDGLKCTGSETNIG